jgi:glyoxylase-like metal-dependent hydrolase (beta-lactamase superfamily II)
MSMPASIQGARESRSASSPREVAPGVYCLETGNGITRSNVYFVCSGASWVLIDTASAHCEREIQRAAALLFGANTPPAAILLTHDHPDHAGSTRELAQQWGCLAYLHPNELPLATMDTSTYLSTVKQYANPLDNWLILPWLRLLPPRRRASMLAASSFKAAARALDLSAQGASVPGLPDWECIPTPGHTPGHVSFFRPRDRVLIAGDAVLTVQLNSFWGFLSWSVGRSKQQIAGPPRYSTWSWRTAMNSVAVLARLEPRVLACGHGAPMSGGTAALQTSLQALADQVREYPAGKEHSDSCVTQGVGGEHECSRVLSRAEDRAGHASAALLGAVGHLPSAWSGLGRTSLSRARLSISPLVGAARGQGEPWQTSGRPRWES